MQTLGNHFEVDGRFKGDLNVTTINCNTNAGTCTIPVPSPGFALVFLDNNNPEASVGQATQTFATTAYTRTHNTVFVDPTVVANSNGHSGISREGLGSTSQGSVSAAQRRASVGTGGMITLLGAVMLGGAWVVRTLTQ